MNGRERAVVVVLIVALVAGAAAGWARRFAAGRRAANSVLLISGAVADSTQSAMPAGPAPAVDINSATVRQLDALPGIGPVIAARIIEYRTRTGGFRSTEELRKVSGVGPKRYAAIRDLVTAEAAATADSGR